jgi:hypothetical protein
MPEKAKATLALAARVGQLLDDIEITSVAAVVSPGGLVREHIGIAIVIIQHIIGVRRVIPSPSFQMPGSFAAPRVGRYPSSKRYMYPRCPVPSSWKLPWRVA